MAQVRVGQPKQAPSKSKTIKNKKEENEEEETKEGEESKGVVGEEEVFGEGRRGNTNV